MRSFPWDSLVTSFGDDGFPIYDRDYMASDLREVYKTFFSNGVFMDTDQALQVTEGDGMNVLVAAGNCNINGTIGYEKNQRMLTIQASDTTYDRIDTVVLRWNANVEMRNIDLYVKTGVAQQVPVRPTLTRSETVFELGLGDVFVNKGAGAISAARITDTRLENERCGMVVPFIEVDTTTFYNQIQGAIDAKIAEIDALANFTYLQGGFYALDAEGDKLYAYYDSEDNPPPLSLEGGNLYYQVGNNRLFLGSTGSSPAGTVTAYAGIEAPDGWLICNGDEVSREDYPMLFDAIGEIYGEGDGETTFNVPNFVGRFAFGSSKTRGIGTTGGEEVVKLTEDTIPSHRHTMPTFAAGVGDGGDAVQRGWFGTTAYKELTTTATGGSNPHENMPPYLAINYIISTGA